MGTRTPLLLAFVRCRIGTTFFFKMKPASGGRPMMPRPAWRTDIFRGRTTACQSQRARARDFAGERGRRMSYSSRALERGKS